MTCNRIEKNGFVVKLITFTLHLFFLAEAASEAVREKLLAILEQMLLGDRLAAEYLLCHLISTVYDV